MAEPERTQFLIQDKALACHVRLVFARSSTRSRSWPRSSSSTRDVRLHRPCWRWRPSFTASCCRSMTFRVWPCRASSRRCHNRIRVVPRWTIRPTGKLNDLVCCARALLRRACKGFPVSKRVVRVEGLNRRPSDDGCCGVAPLFLCSSSSKICEMWWVQERPGGEHLVTQLLPLMLVRSLDADAKEADVKRMHG